MKRPKGNGSREEGQPDPSASPFPGAARAGRGRRRKESQEDLWEEGGSADLFRAERELLLRGFRRIAGIDEAGRGPLAGPVVAAAVVLAPGLCYEGLTDSKQLTARERESWFERISATAVDYGIATVTHEQIDLLNIVVATRKAMEMAVARLSCQPDYLLIDGIFPLQTRIEQRCIKHGDRRSHSIAAASVLAKVTRDRLMEAFHAEYPQYRFDQNKGYATLDHREALRKFGFCPLHRRSFHGVKETLDPEATLLETPVPLPARRT
ncbi:MAG: ribonuclease HII [bacterium]